MAELLVRASSIDRGVLEHLAARPTGPGLDRLVVDAHTALDRTIAEPLRSRGIPLLIDPQTYFLQDRQHPGDAWAKLPFGTPDRLTPGDLLYVARVDELIDTCLRYQIEHGATQLIAPYVHVERGDEDWAQVQALIYRRCRRYLDVNSVAFKVLAPAAMGWSLLVYGRRSVAFDVLHAALHELAPTEIAIAASKVDEGARAWDRLSDFVAVIPQLAEIAPVIAWQQGALGEAAVAAGAHGYETGIGWRERCQLRQAAAAHRKPSESTPIGARPTYIHRLMRSVPRRTLEIAAQIPTIAADLTCLHGDCCPAGRTGLTQDAREHSVLSRARSLRDLATVESPQWRWHNLEERAGDGLRLARSLNLLADRNERAVHVDVHALKAIQFVAHSQQRLAPRRVA